MSILRPTNAWEGLAHAVVVSDTRPLRLALAIMAFLYPFQLFARLHDPIYAAFIDTLKSPGAIYIWTMFFWVHGFSLLAGLSGRYNTWTLMVEGVMGWGIWTWLAVILSVAQGTPHPTLGAALVMTWIGWRYPTHWTRWGSRDD